MRFVASVFSGLLLATSCLGPARAQWCDELSRSCMPGPSLPPVGGSDGGGPTGGGFSPPPAFMQPNLSSANLSQTMQSAVQGLRPVTSASTAPICQASCTSEISPQSRGSADGGVVRGSEPVLASGEFVYEATDLSLPGYAISYRFSRYYRSGITYLGPMGAAWTYSYAQRVVEKVGDCDSGAYPDVDYYSDRMERMVFKFDHTTAQGVRIYRPESKLPLELHFDDNPDAPWELIDATPLVYRFDRVYGTLTEISEPSGHAIHIDWDRSLWPQLGGTIATVTDTTGRVIRYNYASLTMPVGNETVSAPVLRCISDTGSCENALVSFEHKATQPAPGSGQSIDFDLVTVRDANGDPQTYSYYSGAIPDLPYLADELAVKACTSFCGSKSASCHNFDACRTSVDAVVAESCGPIGLAFRDPNQSCYAYCAQTCTDDDPSRCFADPPNPFSCSMVEYQSFCSHPQNAQSAACTQVCVNQALAPAPAHIQCQPEQGELRGYPDLCSKGKGLCTSQYTAMALASPEMAACPQQCEQSCRDRFGTRNSNGSRRPVFGNPSDLRHNLVRVTDGDGRHVLENVYGTDPFQFNFDKVVAQHFAPSSIAAVVGSKLSPRVRAPRNPRSSIPTRVTKVAPTLALVASRDPMTGSVMSFEYHDLSLEPNPGPAVSAAAAFGPVEVCPQTCNQWTVRPAPHGRPVPVCVESGAAYEPARASSPYFGVQLPRYAVVATDIDNSSTTRYYDVTWRLLREVNNDTGSRANFNYSASSLTGIEHEDKQRTCLEADAFARPTRITRLPAPSRPGSRSADEIRITYDAQGAAIAVVRDPSSSDPAGKAYVRDAFERVVATGERIGSNVTRWTCYEYEDTQSIFYQKPQTLTDLVATVLPRPLIVVPPTTQFVSTKAVEAATAHAPPGLFDRTGCATPQLVRTTRAQPGPGAVQFLGAQFRAVLPSKVTLPDGTLNRLTEISASGPGKFTVDASGADPITTSFVYDLAGHTTQMARSYPDGSLGPVAKHLFDAGGREIGATVTDGSGRSLETRFGYDRSRHVVEVDGPAFKRTMRVNALGALISVSDHPPAGDPTPARVTCFKFDVHGRLPARARAEGNVDLMAFDSMGRATAIWRGTAPFGDAEWMRDCKRTGLPAAMEQVASWQYDANGTLTSQMSDGTTTEYIVDGFGRVIDEILPYEHLTLRVPQANGRLKSVPYTAKLHKVQGFDRFGRVSWQGYFDAAPSNYALPGAPNNGIYSLAQYSYDLIGRPTAVSRWRFSGSPPTADAAGLLATTSLAYDDARGITSMTDSNGRTTRIRRDGVGRVVEEARAVGTANEYVTSIQPAKQGRELTITMPAPTASGTQNRLEVYDEYGNLNSVSIDGQVVASLDYDPLGRPKTLHRLPDVSVTTAYDAFGRETTWTRVFDGTTTSQTRLEYDRNDRPIRFVDAGGRETRWDYDRLDRLLAVTNELGQTRYTYPSGVAVPKSTVEASGVSRALSYDLLHRLTREDIQAPAGLSNPIPTRVVRYSPMGQPTHVEAWAGAALLSRVEIGYDSMGRRVSEKNSTQPYSITRAFPGSTVVTQVAGPSAATLKKTYDELGRPSSISWNGQSVATVTYARGAVTSVLFGNAVEQAVQRDPGGHSTGFNLTLGGAVVAGMQSALGVDAIPRAVRWQRAGASEMDLFTVDGAARLTSENLGVLNQSLPASPVSDAAIRSIQDPAASLSRYTLDLNDNWSARTGTDALAAVIGPANRYAALNSQSLSYDAAGNTSTLLGSSFEFGANGRLVDAQNGSGHIAYAYDALDRRTTEVSNGSATQLLWDGDSLLGSVKDGKLQLRLDMDPIGTLALADSNGVQTYLHSTAANSIIAATDSQGALVERYRYSGYGQTTIVGSDGTVLPASLRGNRFMFQGQLYQPEVGVYSIGAREYSPRIGRFLSADPAGLAGGSNLYAFVGARPLTHSDPDGLSSEPLLLDKEAMARIEVTALYHAYAREHPYWSYGNRAGFDQLRTVIQGIRNRDVPWAYKPFLMATAVGTVPLYLIENIGAGISEMTVNIPNKFGRDAFVQRELNKRGYFAYTEIAPGHYATGTPILHEALFDVSVVAGAVPTSLLAPEGALLARAGTRGGALVATLGSAEKAEIGVQLTAGRAISMGTRLLGDEVTFENLVTGVRGRMDLVGRVPGLPEEFIVGLESKAGMNPRFTSGQAVNIEWMGGDFVPVRFIGGNAAGAGLSTEAVYFLNMDVVRWIF